MRTNGHHRPTENRLKDKVNTQQQSHIAFTKRKPATSVKKRFTLIYKNKYKRYTAKKRSSQVKCEDYYCHVMAGTVSGTFSNITCWKSYKI